MFTTPDIASGVACEGTVVVALPALKDPSLPAPMRASARASTESGRERTGGATFHAGPVHDAVALERRAELSLARERYLVVTHLLDVVHERTNCVEKAAELGALAESAEVPLFGVPLDANDLVGRILGAARDLVALAMLRGVKGSRCTPIRLVERLRAVRADRVADVLDDHALTSSHASFAVSRSRTRRGGESRVASRRLRHGHRGRGRGSGSNP